MSENIDNDLLISLIEERPVLWDKTIDDFKDKNLKTEGWKDVCRNIFPDFDGKNDREKTRLGNAVLKKWTHIKDNFTRYLKKLETLNKSGSGASKIKAYHLYNQLLFLKKNAANLTDSSIIEEDEEDEMPYEKNENKRSRYQPTPRKRKVNDEVDHEILQALKETENRHLSFFKAILPSLNTLDDHQTLTFQSRVLKILTDLHQITYNYDTPTGYNTASQGMYQRPQSSYLSTNYQPTQTSTYQSTMSSNFSKTPAQNTRSMYEPSTSSNPKPTNSTFEELSNDCEDESNATLESTYDFS